LHSIQKGGAMIAPARKEPLASISCADHDLPMRAPACGARLVRRSAPFFLLLGAVLAIGIASGAPIPANATQILPGSTHLAGHLNQTDVLTFRLNGTTSDQWHAGAASDGAEGVMTLLFTNANETEMWPFPLLAPHLGYAQLPRRDWVQPFYNGTAYYVQLSVWSGAPNASVGLNFTADFDIGPIQGLSDGVPETANLTLNGGVVEYEDPYFVFQAAADERVTLTAQLASVTTSPSYGPVTEFDLVTGNRPFAGYDEFPAGWIRGYPVGRGEFWAVQMLNMTQWTGAGFLLTASFTAPYTGIYYAHVSEYASPFVGTVRVTLTGRSTARSLDGNDAPSEATDLYHRPTFRGNLSYGTDNFDWYRINITSPATLSFTLALNDSQVYPTNVAYDHTAGSLVYVYELAFLSPDGRRAIAVGNSEMPGLVGGYSSISITVPAASLQTPGTYLVKATVLLSGHPTNASYANYTLTVTLPNSPPVPAAPPGPISALEDTPAAFDVGAYFSDPEGDGMTYSFTGLPAGASASFSGSTATVVPSLDFNGNLTLVLQAVDWFNAAAYADLVISFSPVNDAPRVNLSNLPAGLFWDQGGSSANTSFLVVFTDPDGDPLNISSPGTPNVTATACGALCLAFTAPSPYYFGNGSVSIVATDPLGLSSNVTLPFIVRHINHPPSVLPGAPTVVDIVASVSHAVLAPTDFCTDFDNESLGLRVGAVDPLPSPFTAVPQPALPGALNVSVQSASISGEWTLSVECFDAANAAAASDLVVHVHFPPRRPTVASSVPGTSNFTADENSSITLSASFVDPDGEVLVLSWSVDGLPVTGIGPSGLVWDFNFTSAGLHRFAVVARDPGGLNATVQWNVTVGNVDRPPVCGISTPEGVSGNAGSKLNITSTSVDPDGSDLTYRWTANGSLVGVDSTYAALLVPGTRVIRLEVTADGATASCQVTLSGVVHEEPGTQPPQPTGSVLPLVAAAAAIAAIAAVGLVVLKRRKKAP
jgi:hypothetical protein